MKKIQISKHVLIVISALLLVAVAIATGSVIAKYAEERKSETSDVTAKLFYFESDYLTDDDHTYYLNPTTQSISLKLYNFQNEMCADPDCTDCQFTSQLDCEYTVKVTCEDDSSFTVKIDGVATEATAVIDSSNTPKNKKTTHTVTIEGIKPGHDYKIEVTANGGYTKTLSAKFEVAELNSGFYMNVDESNASYVILTVWAEGEYTGNVTITVPAKLIPDTTDPIMSSIDDYDGSSYIILDDTSFASEFSSRSYRFFKDAGYTTADFTVTITKNEVTTTAEESLIP